MRTVSELNRLYLPAHADAASIATLVSAFHDAQAALRLPRPIVHRPAQIDAARRLLPRCRDRGHDRSFWLETLLAPDLLDVERPFVIAHEWGHLAGFADESEANFIAWLACLRGHRECSTAPG